MFGLDFYLHKPQNLCNCLYFKRKSLYHSCIVMFRNLMVIKDNESVETVRVDHFCSPVGIICDPEAHLLSQMQLPENAAFLLLFSGLH